VVGRQAPAAHPVQEHRGPDGVGELPELALSARPVQIGPRHDHRSFRRRENRRGAIGVVRGRALIAFGRRRNLRLGLHEHDVERVVDERRPAGELDRAVERASGHLGDCRGVLDGLRRLRERGDERHVVDLLEAARAPSHLGRPPAEHDERRPVLLRPGDRAHPVGDAGAGGQRAHARAAGCLRPPLRSPRRRLLVPRVDDVDPLVLAAVVDREQVTAGEREQLRDAARRERAGHQPAAVNRAFAGVRRRLGCLLWGLRHRDGEPTSDRAIS
jgi:hypothetical protein